MSLDLSKISPYCVDSANETCFGLDWYTRAETGTILIQKRVVQSLLPKKKQRIDAIIGVLTKKDMIQILRYHRNPLVREDMNKVQLIGLLLGSKNAKQNDIEAYYMRIKQWMQDGNVKFKGPPRRGNKVGDGRKGPTFSARAIFMSSIKNNGTPLPPVGLHSKRNSPIRSLHFPVHVSPHSPVRISPVRSPVHNSPYQSPVRISPVRNSPVRSPVHVSPVRISPVRSPVHVSPYQSPVRNSPYQSPQSPVYASPYQSPRSPHAPVSTGKKCVLFSKRKPVGDAGNVVEIDGKTLTMGTKIKLELTADVEYYVWIPTSHTLSPGTYTITATPQVSNVSSQEKAVTVERQLIPKSYEGIMGGKKGVFLPTTFSLSNRSSFFVKNPKSSHGKGSTNNVISVTGGGLLWKSKIYHVKPHAAKKNSPPSPPSSPILSQKTTSPRKNASPSPILSRSSPKEAPRIVSQKTTSPRHSIHLPVRKSPHHEAQSPTYAPVSLPQRIQRSQRASQKKSKVVNFDYDGDMPPPLGGPNIRYKPPRVSSRQL